MNIRFQLMGYFNITVDGKLYDSLACKSRRGVQLIKYLILQRGKSVSVPRLIRDLFASGHYDNPENALKTLISRTRKLLNEVHLGLGDCIASVSNGYCWLSLPGVKVDVLEIMDILDALHANPSYEIRAALTEQLLDLYKGELEDEYWLHREYLEAAYDFVAQLKANEAYNKIIEVCKRALAIDDADEQLHIFMMEAMASLDYTDEALSEYQRVAKKSRAYFDADLSDDMKSCYRTLVEESKTLKFNVDMIHNELTNEDQMMRGPYFCDYRAFKEIYNIQMRNLERLGSTMFLGVIMLISPNTVKRESGMAGLIEILRNNLRRGDIVTRFSENIVAMLLPIVNYSTGSVVMERIEKLFILETSNANIAFHARISPLGGPSAKLFAGNIGKV